MRALIAALLAAAVGAAAANLEAADPPLRGGSAPHEAQRPDPGADEAQVPLDEETAEETSAAVDPGSLRLISAAALLNRPLSAREGIQIGVIRTLLIDAEDGQARFVLVERPDGKGLTAIPWRTLTIPAESGQPVMAMAAAERLAAAPVLTGDRLGDLTQPRVITEITEFYRPPGGSVDERSQPIGAPAGYIVVSPGQFAAVTAPGQTPATGGMAVATTDGRDIGRIDQVMLDAERGRISYLVVTHPGGQKSARQEGPSWLPLPFEPLQWQADAGTFVLDTDDAQLAQLPTMGRDDVRQGLDEQSVAEIYDQFGVEPYWQ